MKLYKGFRTGVEKHDRKPNVADEVVVLICDGDREPRTLKLTTLAYSKSPTGFNWGYGGSGPAALAHSMLAEAVGLEIADELYQLYKAQVIARLDQDKPWVISAESIDQFVADRPTK